MIFVLRAGVKAKALSSGKRIGPSGFEDERMRNEITFILSLKISMFFDFVVSEALAEKVREEIRRRDKTFIVYSNKVGLRFIRCRMQIYKQEVCQLFS